MWQAQRSRDSIANEHNRMHMQKIRKADKQTTRKVMRKNSRNVYTQSVQVKALSALHTNTPFIERLVHFWVNHFSISIEKQAVKALAGAYELEAIRPYVLGHFKDILFAVEQDPAILSMRGGIVLRLRTGRNANPIRKLVSMKV